MAKTPRANCHACGQKLKLEETVCPRCRVSRRGDVNKPMVAAYGFFLLLMLIFGTLTIMYLRSRGAY